MGVAVGQGVVGDGTWKGLAESVGEGDADPVNAGEATAALHAEAASATANAAPAARRFV